MAAQRCLGYQTGGVGDSSDVPALRRGLAVLRLLASHAGPMTATAIAGELGLPRSTTYHLLGELAEAGFVTHLPEERRYGLGVAAFELGSAYLRHDPLERLARPLLRRLVERVGATRAPRRAARRGNAVPAAGAARPAADAGHRRRRAAAGAAPGVRPRHAGQAARGAGAGAVPGPGQFRRPHRSRPADLPSLRRLLAVERRRGWAVEDGHVTPGFASVAAAVLDHGDRPVAAISVTFRHECDDERGCGRNWPEPATGVLAAADELSTRIGGHGSGRHPRVTAR